MKIDSLVKLTALFLLIFPNLSYSKTFTTKGFVNFSAASRNQSSAFEQQNLPDGFTTNRLSNPQSIGSDAQILFSFTEGNVDDVEYGVTAQTELNFNSDGRNENPNLDQVFTFAEGDFGKFEFGNKKAVNQEMKVGPAHSARGAGGINGKYLEQVNLPMFAGSVNGSSQILPRFILLAQSPVGHGGYSKSFYRRGADNDYSSGDYSAFDRSRFRTIKDDSFDGMEDATKINYFSPRIYGVKLGASYAPNSSNHGPTKQVMKDVDQLLIKDIFSFGANYAGDFDNLGVDLSATAEKGKSKTINRSDLFSYDLGGSLSYFGFTLGASYGSWGTSLQPTSGIYANQGGTKYRTLGLVYKFGPIGTSISNIQSSFQKNGYKATSLGFDYKLTRNLMPYFEVTKFAFNSVNQDVKDNHGYVFLTGIFYSF